MVFAMKILTLVGMDGGLQVPKRVWELPYSLCANIAPYCDAKKALRKTSIGLRSWLGGGETLDQASTLASRNNLKSPNLD
jgi:hypothetical protein